MKKSFLLVSALVLTISSAFADCGCGRPNFTEADETDAVYRFMDNKLKVTDVRTISVTATLPYATYNPSTDPSMGPIYQYGFGYFGQYPGMGQFGMMDISRTGLTKCQVQCLNTENSIRKLNVEFVKDGKLCNVDLKVTMTSKRRGFKSKVKQKYAPVCE